DKSAANSPVKPSAPAGPARMVLAVPDEPGRGRKPVLRNELAVVVAKQQYPPERLRFTEFSPASVSVMRTKRFFLPTARRLATT
ncbi:MAG: hypothetical protein JXA30_13085, partial [Deltaproteobacteria bacterium]|nr:hypothetical protein [Deltaproteobacteria bacterium]